MLIGILEYAMLLHRTEMMDTIRLLASYLHLLWVFIWPMYFFNKTETNRIKRMTFDSQKKNASTFPSIISQNRSGLFYCFRQFWGLESPSETSAGPP